MLIKFSQVSIFRAALVDIMMGRSRVWSTINIRLLATVRSKIDQASTRRRSLRDVSYWMGNSMFANSTLSFSINFTSVPRLAAR